MGRRSDRHQAATHLYAQAIAIVDPIRIRMWSEAELTTGQLRLMFFLHREPGASLTTLAGHLGISAPTASGLVDRLARQGYVSRQEDTHDRRFVRHELTERGQALATELEREGRRLLEDIFSRLNDEDLTALMHGLAALVAAAEQVQPTAEAPA